MSDELRCKQISDSHQAVRSTQQSNNNIIHHENNYLLHHPKLHGGVEPESGLQLLSSSLSNLSLYLSHPHNLSLFVNRCSALFPATAGPHSYAMS